MKSQPIVGQDVHFYPSTNARAHRDAPLAAKIAHVWAPNMVNLAVFDANGHAYDAECTTSVPLVQDGDDRPDGFFCEYPPLPNLAGLVPGEPLKLELLEIKGCDFNLRDKVSLASGETGIIVAQMESIRTNPLYHVQYKNGGGCQVEDWFYATDLTLVEEEKNQEDAPEPQAEQEASEKQSTVPPWKQ